MIEATVEQSTRLGQLGVEIFSEKKFYGPAKDKGDCPFHFYQWGDSISIQVQGMSTTIEPDYRNYNEISSLIQIENIGNNH